MPGFDLSWRQISKQQDRECAPDDRLDEASIAPRKGRMDCFVASLLAMTA